MAQPDGPIKWKVTADSPPGEAAPGSYGWGFASLEQAQAKARELRDAKWVNIVVLSIDNRELSKPDANPTRGSKAAC